MQYGWEPGAKLRYKAEQDDFQNHDDGEGNRTCNNLLDAAVRADSLYNEEIHANRRGNQSKLHIDQHDDIEPNEIKTKLLDNGEEHRQSDKDDGYGLQDTAEQ